MSAADIQNKIDSILGGLNEEEVKQINREKIENFLKKKSEIIPNSKLEDWMDLSSPEKQVVLGDFNKEEIKIIEEMLPKKEDDGTPRLSKHEPDVRKKQFTLNDSVDNIVALYGNKIAGWAEALKNNLNEGLPFVTKEQQKQIGSISDVTGLSIEEQKNAVNSIQNYGRSLERYKKNVPSLSDGFQFDDVFDSDFWLGVAIPQAAGFIPELAVSYITKGAIGRTGTFTNLRPLYRHVIEGMIGGVPSSLSEASIQANNAKREAIANNKSDKEVEDIYNSVFGKTFFSTLGLESAQLLPIAGLINKSSPNASLLRKLGRGTLDFVEGAGLEGSEERLQEWVSMKELYPDSIGFKDLVTLGNGRLDEATTIGLVLGGAYGGVNIVTPMFETDVKTEMERNGSDKLKEELQKKTQETTDVKTSERNGEIINRMLEDESVSQEVKNEMVS
ncbi:MAG: hypothetical protein GWN01_03775, partial [Nitrosopumilaceae archaeon]|nr:hypothetical protein [Nitrosopumilaceae archaeon]NIU86459.1 hypothetical protein [Nitrosopumilaceae archaeon]NIV65225.1 hypothetical protein [Nitrosopumilaceae archaeon]NIX60677.1 hypothetical protein [Nitrosopumilaceae archaeon]